MICKTRLVNKETLLYYQGSFLLCIILMKKIKLWVLAFLIGQMVTIFRTDKKFKKEYTKKEWRDKIKFAAEKLFDFNKQLVADTHQSIKSSDLKKHMDHIGSYFQQEYTVLKDYVKNAEQERKDAPQEAIQWHIDELTTRFEAFKTTVWSYVNELDEKYALKDKMKDLKKYIDEVVTKFTYEISEKPSKKDWK